MRLRIRNLTNQPVDSKLATRTIFEHLAKQKGKAIIELSVVFLSPQKIQAINKRYRNQDYVPDVLTFPKPLHEILICPQQARKNGHTIQFLLKHALDDLLGKRRQ